MLRVRLADVVTISPFGIAFASPSRFTVVVSKWYAVRLLLQNPRERRSWESLAWEMC